MALKGARLSVERRAVLVLAVAAWALVVVLWAADGPLTPLMNLKTRTDAAGYLMVSAAGATGASGPLTPMANLRGRTDANGYLRVTLDGGTANPATLNTDLLCLDVTNHDTCSVRDAANTWAHRNGTNPQTVRVYNTFTDASNYERFAVEWASNILFLETKAAGTGTSRALTIGTQGSSPLNLETAGSTRWTVGASTGNLQAGTDNTYSIGLTGASRPSQVFVGAPSITTAGATGLTINDSGSVRTQTAKITLDRTNAGFQVAALTADVTIATLPANTQLVEVFASLTTTFACSATCTTATLSGILGKGAGGAEYVASFDADASTIFLGDADAELGTLMTRAAAIQGGTFNTGSQNVVFRLTSGTGNIGTGAATNLSQGSITFWITTRVLQ